MVTSGLRMEGFVRFEILLGLLVLTLTSPEVEAQTSSKKSLVSALYFFGDSTTDAGNNNGLATVAKANFHPYGRDFVNHQPSGRFSNEKLATDVLSGLLGLPDLLPAYLDPAFQGQKLLTGCSFGSAASGYDDTTSLTLNVLTVGKQLENFRRYRGRLEGVVGRGNASKIISEALFAISSGTNDFVNNYYVNPLKRHRYSVEQYQDLLIQTLRRFVQTIYEEGATKLIIFGLVPFGCLPSQITLYNSVGNTCFEEFNDVARSFNNKIVALTKNINLNYPGLRIAYMDLYQPVYDILGDHIKYGIEEVRRGCCGTGLLEASIACNEMSPVCPDASKYLFWDSFHPTARASIIVINGLFHQVLRLLQ